MEWKTDFLKAIHTWAHPGKHSVFPVVWEPLSLKATRVESKMASCALRKHCHLVATTSSHRHKDLKVPLTVFQDNSASALSSHIPCIYIIHYTLYCAFYVYCYLTFQGSPSFYGWGSWGSERTSSSILLSFIHSRFICQAPLRDSHYPRLGVGGWVTSDSKLRHNVPKSFTVYGDTELRMLELGFVSRTKVYQCSYDYNMVQ